MKILASVCASVLFLTFASQASTARGNGLGDADNAEIARRADQIVANASAESPEMTCRDIQVAAQAVAGAQADRRRNHAVVRALKRALRRRLDRHEVMRRCFGCIAKQSRSAEPAVCGVHGLCETGGPLSPSDSSCVAQICDTASECCTDQWDEACVARVTSICSIDCSSTPATTTTVPHATTTTVASPPTTVTGATTTTLPARSACPDSIELTLIAGTRDACQSNADCEVGSCNTGLGRCQTRTELDTGWTGISHDADVTDEVSVRARLSCPGSGTDCGVCDVGGLRPDPGNCRCANDNRQICDQPFHADADDCGGQLCNCYLGPPLSLSAGNTPVCVVNRFFQDVSGTTNLSTGDGATTVNLRSVVFLGENLVQPCPYCSGDTTARDGVRDGTCVLGANPGASCDADGFNFTFPAPGGNAHSLDCFPASGKNVSGTGLAINLAQTTGSSTLGSQVTCGLPPQITMQCQCGLCSGNQSLPCSTNAQCSAAGAGTCERKGAFDPSPNQCDGSCVDAGGGEGQCDAGGPTDLGCDGVRRANGESFIACTSNADCDPSNIGIDGGNCTMSKRRDCFLPTIVANGTPDPTFPVSVATFCIPPTANSGINSTAGLPGPGRVVSQGKTTAFCGNDVYSPDTGCPGGPPTTVVGSSSTTLPPPTSTVPVTTTLGSGPTTTLGSTTTTTTLSNACGNTFPACGGECPAGTACTNTGQTCHCASSGGCAPTTMFRRFKSRLGDFPNSVRQTQLSTGWSGTSHQIDIPGDLGATDAVDLACNANCENCSVNLNPIKSEPEAYCRCENNAQRVCDTINGADADDCGSINNRCQCNFGPPLAISAGGTPVCVVNRMKNDYSGTANLRTGEWFDTANLVSLVHLGISTTQPCPTCDGDVTANDGVRNGTCNGGLSTGSCDVNGVHPTFGPVSFDCPPNPNSNVSGNGLQINLNFSSGTVSLAATLPCSSPFQSFECPCKVCSGDGTLGCSSDAQCQAAGAGACTASGGAGAHPNACTDLVCGADADCDAGPVDKYCDGTTAPDGRGFITCTTDAECQATGQGACSISEQRRCYPDPIVRSGRADPVEGVKVSIFCIPPTTSAAVNNSGGLPGPGTFDLQFVADARCRDDLSVAYQLPDGSNCAPVSTTTTSTTMPLAPCADAVAPLCAGSCGAGQGCVDLGGSCGCATVTTTTLPACGGQFPLCSGNCATGQLCLPDVPTQTCLCVVVQ